MPLKAVERNDTKESGGAWIASEATTDKKEGVETVIHVNDIAPDQKNNDQPLFNSEEIGINENKKDVQSPFEAISAIARAFQETQIDNPEATKQQNLEIAAKKTVSTFLFHYSTLLESIYKVRFITAISFKESKSSKNSVNVTLTLKSAEDCSQLKLL